MAHDLIIGGTGMLRGVVLHLAAKSGTVVSVVARRRTGLENLARSATGVKGRVEPIAVDYRSDAAFRSALSSAVGLDGPVRVAVCWIHDPVDQPLEAVLAALRSGKPAPGKRTLLLHVLGSAHADPSKNTPKPPVPKNDPHIEYRRVILGFKVIEGKSRWLTDAEVSEGVIAALSASQAQVTIGQTEPWSARPSR